MRSNHRPALIRPRTLLGKYRIERRIDRGGFADVYRAYDTIEGILVVLKVPHPNFVDSDTLEMFKREARLTAKLDHPNILTIKTADFIDGHFVIVTPLGLCNLAERSRRRISLKKTLDYSEQMLDALAYAHDRRIVHCDVKPENLILFEEDVLRLTDFGIAKVAFRTLRAEGTGTVGYVAPEQAMGRPSFRSDVFSAGLVMWRLFAGRLPEWPFQWPFPGHERLRKRVHPDLIQLMRRSVELVPAQRFDDAVRMLEAFQRIKHRVLMLDSQRARRRLPSSGTDNGRDWKAVRFRQFQRQFGRELRTRHECSSCSGPVSEAMRFCPWCRVSRRGHDGPVDLPAECPRCKRGLKLDWRFCPWCYGGLVGPLSDRHFTDVRYESTCASTSCRGPLMPFMRYCPWCNTRVRKKWRIADASEPCKRCGWGVLRGFWEGCPWCGTAAARATSR